jgi:hypothetical protein
MEVREIFAMAQKLRTNTEIPPVAMGRWNQLRASSTRDYCSDAKLLWPIYPIPGC